MNTVRRSLSTVSRFARPATFVMSIAAAGVASAQTAPSPDPATSTSYAEFQLSTLTGSGNTIVASWVPVVTPSGTTYYNVTLPFTVDSSGKLSISPRVTQIVPAPIVLVSNFMAGNYTGPSTEPSFFLTVGGPGVTADGATEWSLAASAGATTCTYPSTATWYVGPIANNPWATRIQAAGIDATLQNSLFFGVGGFAPGCISSANWFPNSLLGFSQTGSQLTIVSFTTSNVDHSTSVDQITYALQP